ncbi:hypothetical protein [Micromonospora carbonacea]|uniref:Uncharacterized protein n=1 Tax=Micromonospora carbonacea TaxID=47853 RepID=A0A1C5ACR7_9ACTN|nr:hypothetical protein [Micromonospora carbonacea]SCF43042.1 hypothetical protein GA0070563_112179 [Micromonospora carbonacea]
MSEHVYATSDPTIVAAYRRAVADRAEMGKRIAADVKALGAGPRVFVRTSGFSGIPTQLTAIEQQGDHVPDGWRVVRGNLEPRRGKPGESAREWLANHQPVDVRDAMEKHGLPRACWLPRDREFGWTISQCRLFEHDGTLWASYAAEPGTSDSGFDTERCSWESRKLSEFYAAREAMEAAEQVAGVAA